MKKFPKFISIFLSLMLFLTAAMPAFAAESTPTSADAATDSILSATEPTVSESNASLFGTVPMRTYDFEDYGVSITLPDDGSYLTVNSPETEIYSVIGVGLAGMLENGYLVYPCSYEGVMFSLTVSENIYSLNVGDYSNLSADKKQEMIDAANSYNLTSGFSDVRFVTINGHDFFVNCNFYDYYGVYQYTYVTVVDGVKYQFEAVSYNEISESDAKFIENTIVGSLKINKPNYSGGLASGLSVLEIIALIAVAVLLIVVGFLTFFIIRFNAFSKAAGSSFNIIGFNMPPKSYDYDDDDDDDDFEDDDDDDDDDQQ